MVLSLLIALVLGTQLYLIYRVEEDLLKEIEGFSNSINLATDSYYSSILEDIQEVEKNIHNGINVPLPDTVCFPENQSKRDSLYVNVINELKNLQGINQYNSNIIVDKANDLDHQNTFVHKDIGKFNEKVEEKIFSVKRYEIKEDEGNRRERGPQALLNLPKGKVNSDYPKRVVTPYPIIFETVDINLNDMMNLHGKHFPVFPKPVDFKRRSRHQKNFIIRIPDFSLPNSPKILRYNYSSEKIEKAFINSRNKNLLITGSLFLIFIFAVSLISKRFLKPIGILSTSFERVESGDLDVSILNKSKDEIGNLTRSFNHMVSEMRKNREKEKVLKRKEHLASMGQLAAGVAHEIKNPLNAINLTIDHLKDKYADDDETFQKYIFTIQNEILRLDKIVDNFLGFVRNEDLKKSPTDMNALILDIIHLLNRELESRKISVKINFDESFFIDVDNERFKTVIMNIILNAIQAVPEKGIIGLATNKKDNTIIISDNGVGIAHNDLDKIFDLFYTSKSKGTGLGLPTAYKIVKEHGGDIFIESEVGKGTKVTIKL